MHKPLFIFLPICLIIYGFTGGLSNDIYLPAMPSMTEYFNTTDMMVQLTLTSWGIGVGVFQLFMGPWSDHYGRRPALLWGGFIFLLGSLGCALAPTVEWMLLARFIQGIGTCSMFMITITAMKEVFTQEERLKWLVYYNMMRSLAPLIGPVLGAYILLIYHWRGIFVLIAALAATALLGLVFSLPETNPRNTTDSFSFKKILNDYRESLSDKYLVRYLLAGASIFGGMMVYLTSGAFLMVDRIGISEQAFGYSQVVISLFYILGAACIKKGYHYLGAFKVIGLGVMSCLIASFLMFSTYWDENLWTVLIPVALYSFGFGVASTPITERVLAHEGLKAGIIAGLIGFNITLGASSATFITSLVPVSGVSTACVMLAFSLSAVFFYRWARHT